MNIDAKIKEIQKHPEGERVGMILTHTGIVRGYSKSGRKVSSIEMRVDEKNLDGVIQKHEQMQGIVEVLVEITGHTRLFPGERIMTVVVAGDIRENVLAAMASLIDAVKEEVTHKTEHFV